LRQLRGQIAGFRYLSLKKILTKKSPRTYCKVASIAVNRSTIKFLSNFGVLLTKDHYIEALMFKF
jgi:hypothetical protein